MTTIEMVQAFKIGYDIVNHEGPGYEDEEILVFLNQAQSIEVLKEVALKRWVFLSNLMVNQTLNTAASTAFNYHAVVTPTEEYIGYVSSKSRVIRTGFKVINPSNWIDNILIRKEDSGKYITSSVNKVLIINPRVYEDANRTLVVIHDALTQFTGNADFILDYIRKPEDITLTNDCEVNLIMHERIVNTAVDLGKKVFNPQEAGVSQQTDNLMVNPEP